MIVEADAERLGDAVGRDVVMGRADAAGGENVGVAGAKRVQRGNDLRLFVRNDADFLQVDADIGQVLGDVADVLVLGAAREDFVADNKDGGGDKPPSVLAMPSAIGLNLRASASCSAAAWAAQG